MKVSIRKRKNRSGKTTLYLEFYQNGKKTYEFLNLHLIPAKTPADKQVNKDTLLLAENIRAKRQLEIQSGNYGFSNNVDKQLDFVLYFKKLTTERQNNGINYETWLSVFRQLEKFTGGTISFKDVNEEWMKRFKEYLLANVSQNSAHTYFNKLKAALHRAYKDKLITDNPADSVKSPKQVDTHREYLTYEELQKLAETECEMPLLKQAFLFSALTGIRWSDIVQLRWGNIQHSTDLGWRIVFRQAKTKGQEYLPISDQAKELIGEHKHHEEKVFPGLKYSAWHNLKLSQWVMRAGITKNITFHCARHTHATLLLTNGTDIYTVSKLLGHRELKTTQIYARIIDSKKVEAVNSLPKLKL